MPEVSGGPVVLRDGTVFVGTIYFAYTPSGQADVSATEIALSQVVTTDTDSSGDFTVADLRHGTYTVTMGGDTLSIEVPDGAGPYNFEDLYTATPTPASTDLTFTALAVGFRISGGVVSKTLNILTDTTHGEAASFVPGETPWNNPALAWAMGKMYQLSSQTYNDDGCLLTATVVWPDGNVGVYTTTEANTTWGEVDAYTITYVSGGTTYTFTQATVTRDSDGNITVTPTITMSY